MAINSNIGCIETTDSYQSQVLDSQINSNIGCIETIAYILFCRNKDRLIVI